MGYLRLLINPDDDNAFLRVINTPRRRIGPSVIEGLANYSNERGISLLQGCDELGLEQFLSPQQIEKVRQFSSWLRSVAEKCQRGDSIAIIREMVHDIDYEAWLQQICTTPVAAERAMANVDTLIDSLQKSLLKAAEEGED
jgi:ATP-dependent DNA helicase Rep